MKFDIPFFYSKKLFSDEKFLFYLIKNDYIKTFKVFYNDLNIDLKNEKDVFLIKKMLNFAIKHNSNEIHKFIFREVEKVCDKIGFHYEILSYLIKKGILSNTSNVDFYKKEISYSIKFYNSPFCNYKRNLYPECKKSYPIFMKDYNFLISYLIKNLNKKNIDNIFTLHSIFYYETSFGSNNNVIQTCVKNNNPELLEYYASHKVLNKNNVYYKNNILKGIWFVDFIILPEYRNKGLGKILTEKWMKISPYQLTFCNDLSLNIFKKFGWIENKKYYKTCNPINPLKWIPLIKSMDSKILNKINFFKFS